MKKFDHLMSVEHGFSALHWTCVMAALALGTLCGLMLFGLE